MEKTVPLTTAKGIIATSLSVRPKDLSSRTNSVWVNVSGMAVLKYVFTKGILVKFCSVGHDYLNSSQNIILILAKEV